MHHILATMHIYPIVKSQQRVELLSLSMVEYLKIKSEIMTIGKTETQEMSIYDAISLYCTQLLFDSFSRNML